MADRFCLAAIAWFQTNESWCGFVELRVHCSQLFHLSVYVVYNDRVFSLGSVHKYCLWQKWKNTYMNPKSVSLVMTSKLLSNRNTSWLAQTCLVAERVRTGWQKKDTY
jgi:hypothetical protein